jgi:superfamily II RNA helicase
MLEELEELTKVREVENSTLKMGYNEEDYIITRKEYPNCVHEYIVPKGYERKEKFVRPKEFDKVYKFKLDKFQDKAVECI